MDKNAKPFLHQKINFGIAQKIRKEHAKGVETKALAQRYLLSESHVTSILNGSAWVSEERRKSVRKLDSNVVALILEARDSGFSFKEISERFDISYQHARNIVNGKSWENKKATNVKLTHDDAIKIRGLYDKGGVTMEELGRQFNTSVSNICTILKEQTWNKVSHATQNYLETKNENESFEKVICRGNETEITPAKARVLKNAAQCGLSLQQMEKEFGIGVGLIKKVLLGERGLSEPEETHFLEKPSKYEFDY